MISISASTIVTVATGSTVSAFAWKQAEIKDEIMINGMIRMNVICDLVLGVRGV